MGGGAIDDYCTWVVYIHRYESGAVVTFFSFMLLLINLFFVIDQNPYTKMARSEIMSKLKQVNTCGTAAKIVHVTQMFTLR